jgi:hypothetical protein
MVGGREIARQPAAISGQRMVANGADRICLS